MVSGSRFFTLAKKWRKENKESLYFFILQDVMNHYFGVIAGYQNPYKLIIKGAYSKTCIAFVLNAVGYSNYTIAENSVSGNTIVTLREQL